MEPQVLIAGAGPVGLTLAIDLGRRGIRCTLIEKNDVPLGYPKMERCNPRTMEIFRRLGLAETVRAAGYPPDWPMDTYLLFDLMRPPLFKMAYPTVAEAKARRDASHRRLAAARALSDYLAIHARAAAEIGGGENSECRREVRPRVPVVHGGGGRRHRAGQDDRRRADIDPRGLSGRLRRRLERGAQAARLSGWRASRTSWKCARRCSTVPSSTTRCARRAPVITTASTITGR